jgi:hypothetical protein
MKYLALVIAALYGVIYFWGGPVYASCSCSQAGHSTLPYYFIGLAVLAAYYPMYLWRKAGDRRREAEGLPPPPSEVAEATPTAGGTSP